MMVWGSIYKYVKMLFFQSKKGKLATKLLKYHIICSPPFCSIFLPFYFLLLSFPLLFFSFFLNSFFLSFLLLLAV
jgi:hypothetical protein